MLALAVVLTAWGGLPLWKAEGAGAVSRQIIGTAVIGGMLAATGNRDLLDSGDVLYGRAVVHEEGGTKWTCKITAALKRLRPAVLRVSIADETIAPDPYATPRLGT